MRLTPRMPEDPMAARVRRPHFVEIYFRGRPLDTAFVTEVAHGDYDDLRELAREAMLANELDEVKVLSRYLVRVYEHHERRDRAPRRGSRLVDYIPRAEDGGFQGHGHAA